MGTAVWHDLGPAEGGCTVCGAEGALTVGEQRFTQNLLERVRREYLPPPARFVTCRDCGWRWAVRASDRSADGVRARHAARPDALPRPVRPRRSTDVPMAAAVTVLPDQRLPCSGRDWAYRRR